jgi:hypothetical protein
LNQLLGEEKRQEIRMAFLQKDAKKQAKLYAEAARKLPVEKS